MSSLTILLTRSRTGEAVVAALRDWAAAGQLTDFVWVRLGFGTLPDTTFTVSGGELTVAHLPTLIASQAPQRVRLMALWSDLEGDLAGMAAATVAQAEVLRAMNIGHLIPSALNLTREERFDAAGLLILAGFHNLLLAPDDGLGPGDPILALPADDAIPVVGQTSAHAVATLGGLLPGLPESATDEFTLPPGAAVTPVRVFTRVIDASRVEAELRQDTLSLADGYPLVHENGVSSTFIDNIDLATSTMAAHVWNSHTALLMSGRVAPRLEPVEQVGFFAAIKQFFSYLWAAVRSAPGAWVTGMVHTGKTWVADRTTAALFGAGSRVSVVVAGVASTTHDKMAAVRDLADALPQADGAHQVHHDYSPVWRDLVGGSLTLLDGATRTSALPHVDIGGLRGILRSGALVAPGPESSFPVPDAHVRNVTEVSTIPVTDSLALRQLVRRCDAVDPTDPRAAAFSVARNGALQWWEGVRRTYAAKIGERLADEWEARIAEIDAYVRMIVEAQQAAASDDDLIRAQRRLSRWVRVLLIVVLALIIGTIVLGVLAIAGWLVVVGLCLIWVLVWLAGSLIAFLKGRKAVFQARHRRRQAMSHAEAAESNLRAALRDADRIADLYDLLQSWGVVLSQFVAKPLGREPQAAERLTVDAGGHAFAVQFATTDSDPLRVAGVAHTLRSLLFQPGWLSGPWTAFLASAAGDLGTKGVALRANPQALYQQRAVQEDQSLPLWAQHLAAQGANHEAGNLFWQNIIGGLRTRHSALVADLMGSLRLGDGTTPTHEKFVTALNQPDAHPFPIGLFAPITITQDLAVPRFRWPGAGSAGLSEIRTVVDYGSVLSRDQLAAPAPAVSEPDPSWTPGRERAGVGTDASGANRDSPGLSNGHADAAKIPRWTPDLASGPDY